MTWDFFNRREVTARKAHQCVHCGKEIAVGARYQYCAGRFDGDFQAYAEHSECFDAWLALQKHRDAHWSDDTPFLSDDSELPVDDRAWLVANHPLVADRLGFVEVAA